MNTDTAITVHYSDRERRITLLRGEAYFDVAKNPSRPFVVDDGSLTAKALGTHYSVRTAGGVLPQEVQVEEGRVEVATGDDVTVLTPGEAATLGQDGKLLRSRKDVANSMAWREGKLVFPVSPCARFSRCSHNIVAAVFSFLMERPQSNAFQVSSISRIRIRL